MVADVPAADVEARRFRETPGQFPNRRDEVAPVMRVDILTGAMQALVCTAVGLLEAVIVQIMYGILRVRLDRLVSEVEAAASEITALVTSKRMKFKNETEGQEP